MNWYRRQEMPLWCCCGHELVLVPHRPDWSLSFLALDRKTMEVLETCPHCFLPYRFDIQCALKSLSDVPRNFRGEDRI